MLETQPCHLYLSSDGPIQLGLGVKSLADELRIRTPDEWTGCAIHESNQTRAEHELVFRLLRVRHRAEAEWAASQRAAISPLET